MVLKWSRPAHCTHSQIIYLRLSSNRISSLLFLNTFRALKMLDLHDNNISNVTKDAFRTAHQVENINLSGNSIRFVERGAFSHLNELISLNLSDNNIHTLETATLPQAKLQYLYLQFNKLKHISSDAFPGGHTLFLRTLDLSENNLKTFCI